MNEKPTYEELEQKVKKLEKESAAFKRKEEALRQEKKFGEVIIDSLPGLFYVFDEERFVRWNKTWETITGYSPEEFGRMHGPDFFEGADSEYIAGKMQEVFREGASTAEAELVTKDGRKIPYYLTGLRVVFDGKPFLIGMGIDISELKRVEEALQESEEKYRLLVNNLPGIVYKGYTDWSVEFFDRKIELLTGYDADEFNARKMKWSDLIAEEDLKAVKEHFIHAIDTGESYLREYRIKSKTGDIRWIQERGQIVCDDKGDIKYVTGVFFDITHHKQAEDKLKKSERFLQNIFDAIQDGISVLDKDLNILRINNKMEKWYSHAMPFKGKKCYEFYHGRTERCKVCPSIRALEKGMLQMDIVALVESGQSVGWLELYSFPILDENGNPNGIVEYVRNVTERMEAEQALRESEQRFRTVADFTYDWESWIAPDGTYEYVSPSCQRITGYGAHEFLKDAKLLKEIVHPCLLYTSDAADE